MGLEDLSEEQKGTSYLGGRALSSGGWKKNTEEAINGICCLLVCYILAQWVNGLACILTWDSGPSCRNCAIVVDSGASGGCRCLMDINWMPVSAMCLGGSRA